MGKETLELEDVIGALLAFHQRKKNIDENSQGEWLVVKGNYKHGITGVSRKVRILVQSPEGGRTSIAISAERKGT